MSIYNYTWEGEKGDDELYVTKTTNDGKQKHKEQGEPVEKLIMMNKNVTMSSETNQANTYLSDEPIEDARSPLHSDEDETIYVHRSIGVDYVRFDESTMRHPIMGVGTVFLPM